MKTKLTIDNLDLTHSVTYEKMSGVRGDFNQFIPPIQPFSTPIQEPHLFSKLDELFGISHAFRVFSQFYFPRVFGRIRFLFTSRVIPRLSLTACLKCLEDFVDESEISMKEKEALQDCFQEIQKIEGWMIQIYLQIRSKQSSR
ncbi:MAG: DUF5399 domain-containing protein [Verrucomicrobia bacterium]|nr:DUF5399 domain-containing protein [Verrucomicrobiota bacterium]NDE63799.1 hypothetical protein [Chlamydiota bacterium]